MLLSPFRCASLYTRAVPAVIYSALSDFSVPSFDSFWPWFTSLILIPTCKLMSWWSLGLSSPGSFLVLGLPLWPWLLCSWLGLRDWPLWGPKGNLPQHPPQGSPRPLDEKNRHITNVKFHLNLFYTFSGDPCRRCSLCPGLEVCCLE